MPAYRHATAQAKDKPRIWLSKFQLTGQSSVLNSPIAKQLGGLRYR